MQNEILNIISIIVRLKVDNGASSHFIIEKYQHCLDNIVNSIGPIIIMPEAGTL